MVLKKFIESLNNDIELVARKKKSGAQINEAGNKILADLFKARRKSQVKCSNEKYLVPGLFTKVDWNDSATLAAETSSLIINDKLFMNIQNCFGTLKTMMLAMITEALGDNGNNFMKQKKQTIDSILAKEFPSKQTLSYGRQYGGLRKSIKKSKSKSKSRSISRKRTSKKNKMRR
jgi:hypothetical protein